MNTPAERRVHQIPLDLVDADQRLRPVSPDHVEFIASSMAERGQDTPISVREATPGGRHQLISGGHRFAAARQLGWKTMAAEIVAADDLQAKLREIDENLFRRELSALDRAIFIRERKQVYEALNPQTRIGAAPKGRKGDKVATLSPVPSFREETAARLGMDEASINRIVRRAALVDDLSPEMRRALAMHPVAESGAELDAMLRLSPSDRAAVIEEFVLGTPEDRAKSVREALQRIRGPVSGSAAAETEKQYLALLNAWKRAGARARRQFIDFLVSEKAIAEQPAKGGKA